jgi:rhodanese-related sulfurtransferase
MIDVAVPANLRCGAVDSLAAFTSDPDWAPLDYSVTGVWELAPEWLEANPDAAQVVDVREPTEFDGPMGHVPGARLIPLAQLAARMGELDRERPVVAVCRSGSRSAQACVMLAKGGFGRVANLAGGMLRWRGQGYRVEGGAA